MSHRLLDSQKRSRFSWDILGALSLTILCSLAVLAAAGNGTALSLLFGLPLLLFLPGYVLFTALFPATSLLSERVTSNSVNQERMASPAIGPVEGLTLTVVGSISLTMLVGFSMNFTPWGLTLTSTMVTLCGLTVLTGAIAVYRRSRRLPRQQSTQVLSWPGFSNRNGSDQGLLRRDLLVTGFSSIALLFGAGTAVYAVTAPPRGESYSEFHLLTEDENGELVADGYPKEFTSGESRSIVIGISNNEQSTTSYEVIVELHRVSNDEPNSEILDRVLLDQYSTTVQPAETDRTPLSLEPEMTGEQLRLMFFLYRDNAPTDPSVESAYRSLHLWIDVTEP